MEIMHGNRFFGGAAKASLDRWFSGINNLHTYESPAKSVVKIIDKLEVFRARDCENESLKKAIFERPSKEVGIVPREKALSGRMNSAGVPVFYGSLEVKTSIAELRPAVGGVVATAKFELLRPLRVLDFKALESAYDSKERLSFFDPEYEEKVGRRDFLQSLHGRISRPVLPGKENNYLVTQIIAEYLWAVHEPKIDAVIFDSVQVNEGTNIVIFNHFVSGENAFNISTETGSGFLISPEQIMPSTSGLQYIENSLEFHHVRKVTYATVIDDRVRAEGNTTY